MNDRLNFKPVFKVYEHKSPWDDIGKIIQSQGLVYEVSLKGAKIGSVVEFTAMDEVMTEGEVISINGRKCLVMPYMEVSGINTNTLVRVKNDNTKIKLSNKMLGRVLDYCGNPMDDSGEIRGPYDERGFYGKNINPLQRPPISEVLDTGIRAINSFTSLGKGQRLAIMAGSGVGKSVLLGMIARNTSADVNVIALVGERGREVLEFIKNDLGEEGLKRSVIIVATSDQSPLIRMRAAYTASTIAEYFRDQGQDVLFMMDSITRFAMAGREIGLSSGEPPGQKGYPASVFSKLPKLMERSGTKAGVGSITGIYTVLVEGGDMDEPIADAVRSISDGHIILSRELAARNHYPAIDVLNSISRVMNSVVSKEHRIVAGHLRDLLSSYVENEDLINVGAYVKGSNQKVDKAIAIYDKLVEFLRQDISDQGVLEEGYDQMVELAKMAEKSVNPDYLQEEQAKSEDLSKQLNIM